MSGHAGTDVLIDPRVLLIDDNQAIHDDIRKILQAPSARPASLSDMEAKIFDQQRPSESPSVRFQIDSAHQGDQGLAMARAAVDQHRPYAVAFVDVRMPPGMDGIETISQLWKVDARLQVVICTAYSDHRWSEIMGRLAPTDGLLILRKPFDSIEIRQIVHTLSAKWLLRRKLDRRMAELVSTVQGRTRGLASTNERLQQEILTRSRLESELSLAQRMETVGQIASGLAQEGSRSVEQVTESVRALRLAFEDLTTMIATYRRMLLEVSTVPGQQHLVERMQRAEDAVDLVALQQDIPRAFECLVEHATPVAELLTALQETVREETGEHEVFARAAAEAHASDRG